MPQQHAPDTALPLSELQEAAVERIRFFQNELKKYGIYVRTGMELEFAILNENGENIPCRFPIKNPCAYLKEQGIEYVSGYRGEGAVFKHGDRTDVSSWITSGDDEPIMIADDPRPSYRTQYELTIGEEGAFGGPKPQNFMPEKIAQTTEYLRRKGLADMLRDTTMLTAIEPHPQLKEFLKNPTPDFSAHRTYNIALPPYMEVTDCMGLHTNISAFDRNGKNLFAESPELMDHCLQSLVRLQKSSVLANAPTPQSYERYFNGSISVPKGIGSDDAKLVIFDDANAVAYASASKRDEWGLSADEYRIENRLPGADADPYVAMATTMAALYDAVKTHVRVKGLLGKAKDDEKTLSTAEKTLFIAKKSPREASEELPRQFSDIIERYEQSNELKELLGTRLYHAIHHEYAQQQNVGF